jgi:predicted transcriptional regulator
MPHLAIPEDTFQRLAAKAAALNISVDDLVKPALDQIAETSASAPELPMPLAGDAWHAELEAWKRDAESRAGRYPRGFVLDDSRETLYREREDAQL